MLLQRSAALLSALLRLGIAPHAVAYDAQALDRQLPRLAGLIDAIRAARAAPP
jgi:hypothetical protein